MSNIKEFLNPASMLTPGIAGGLTTSISLPLVMAFELKFKWVTLLISFLFSLLLIASVKEPFSKMQKTLLCILNSLIIFSVSIGAGITMNPPPAPPAALLESKAISRSSFQPDIPEEIAKSVKAPLASAQNTGSTAGGKSGKSEVTTSPTTTSGLSTTQVTKSKKDEEEKLKKEYFKEQKKYYDRWTF